MDVVEAEDDSAEEVDADADAELEAACAAELAIDADTAMTHALNRLAHAVTFMGNTLNSLKSESEFSERNEPPEEIRNDIYRAVRAACAHITQAFTGDKR